MTKEQAEKLFDEFEAELELLCKKYNIDISGCGCCGSPSISYDDYKDKNEFYSRDNIGCYL